MAVTLLNEGPGVELPRRWPGSSRSGSARRTTPRGRRGRASHPVSAERIEAAGCPVPRRGLALTVKVGVLKGSVACTRRSTGPRLMAECPAYGDGGERGLCHRGAPTQHDKFDFAPGEERLSGVQRANNEASAGTGHRVRPAS